ncbi:MAG: transposase, partial [Lachnospiraceae bacterium]|nr:transposase [Lachnospiraceae bacterium]
MKNSQRILVTSPFNDSAYWNRNPERRDERLEEIYAAAPDLKLAREALEDFYAVAAEPAFAIRRSALSSWLDKLLASEVPEIRHAAETIKKHRRGIEDAWRFGKSNGATEGLNRKIKDCR